MATRGWALLALLACAALSPLTAQAQDTTISLDGSGNSNFLPLLLRVLETIKVRAKPQPVVSYRSIGTGPGQTELTTTNITLFACGGGKALDATTYANIPVVVSTVSVYVNLNGLQSGQLQLAPCTLAGIYKGDITNWKDIPPADNPSNFTLPDAPIISLYHEEGSSSTLAFTTYLSRACPTFGTTTSLTFTEVVPTPPATSVAVGTTTDMVEQLSSVAGAIGYSEPGQAMAAGLVEVAIQNAANPPLYVFYEQQGPATRVAVPSFSTTTAADWTDKDLTYKSNNWPMAVVNFIQMRRNMQGMGPAGGLARKIAEFFYSQEVIDLLPDYALRPAFNFAPDDETTRGQIIGTVQTLVTVDQAWDDTETKVADPAYATKPYTISALRQGYVLDSVTQLFDITDKTRSAIKQGGTYQLHGGGAFQAADFMRSLMSNLQSQARAPIHATYRDVGTVQAQSEIADVTLSIPNLNNFKVGDAPLESAVWSQLTNCTVDECPGVLHLPFAIGSVSIFFNQQLPSNYLGLQPCMASQIFSGTITQWSDPKLNPDPSVNNGFALGDASDSYVKQPMTVFVYASQSSANRILKAWLATCAGSTWTVDLSPLPATGNVFSNYSITDPKTGKVLQTIPINTPQDMAAALSSTPHSIGFMPSNLGIEQNLDEAALLDIAGGDSYIRTKDTLLTAASNKKLDAGLVFQQLVAAQNLQTKPADSDWSTVSFLTPANGAGGYPLVTLLYVYVYQDLKGFGDSGPLTKALFQYMYSDKGQQLLVASGLQPLPPQLITHFRGELNKLTFAPLLAEWQFETADRITNAGMGLQTFSEVRESSEQALLSSLSDSVGQIQQQVASGVVVRGAGPASAGLSTLVRSMMDDLTAFSSFPVRFNFEEVPDASMPRITSLLVNQSTVSSKVAFLVMDQPLTTAQRQAIPGVVLQSPLMVRPLALLYNNGVGNSTNSTSTTANSTTASNTTTAAAPAPLRMSPCTLAGIVNGKITYWDDAAITGDNPGISLPHNLIQLRAGFGDTSSDAANPTAGAAASGNIKAIIDYVTATCTSEPVNLGSQKFIASDDVVADVLASEAFSVLAVGDPSAVDATLGVQDFALQNIPVNTAVAALSGNFSRANQSTAQQYSDCLLLKVVPNTEDYRLVLDDWSDFTIAGNCQPPAGSAPADGFDAETVASSEVYPLMRVDFLVMPADLKNFSYAGGAIVGMVNYLFQSGFWQSDSLATALPSAAPLPEQQAARSRDMVILLQTADGTPDWPVITSSLDDSVPLSATDRPFITSYAKPVYLATGGYGGGLGGAVSLAAARQAAQEFLAANAQKYTAKVESKDSSTAKTMAIVALAICLVLSLLALAVAGLALRDARRALANSYRPGSLAQVLPATQGMQIMAQMNANPPPLHPAAAALASPSGRKAKGAVLNPTYSYNSRTAPRKPTNGLGGGALGGLTRCLTGQSEDERYKGFMDHQHTAPSEASSASPPPDVKIQMRPNV